MRWSRAGQEQRKSLASFDQLLSCIAKPEVGLQTDYPADRRNHLEQKSPCVRCKIEQRPLLPVQFLQLHQSLPLPHPQPLDVLLLRLELPPRQHAPAPAPAAAHRSLQPKRHRGEKRTKAAPYNLAQQRSCRPQAAQTLDRRISETRDAVRSLPLFPSL